jgi:hypothetical protein
MHPDLGEVGLNFTSPFQVHDENHILCEIGASSVENKSLEDVIPPKELRSLLEFTRIGQLCRYVGPVQYIEFNNPNCL